MALGAADFRLKPIDRDWLLGRLAPLVRGGTPKTILVIDDSEADRRVLKGLLTAHGRFAILEAGRGDEGLRRAREERPDAIFLDLVLPDMTGFEVLEHLKSDPDVSGVPVILNTSATLDEQEIKRLVPKTTAILSKSIGTAEEAFATIREALAGAGLSPAPSGAED